MRGLGAVISHALVKTLSIHISADLTIGAGWQLRPSVEIGELSHPEFCGYTPGMKTAISIPDDLFDKAERLAHRSKRSRSRIFSDAVREYLARHSPEEVTEAANRACSEIGDVEDRFTASAARRIFERNQW